MDIFIINNMVFFNFLSDFMSLEGLIIVFLIPFLVCGFSMNTPEYYSVITYLWVIGVAIAGSLVSRFQEWKEHKRKRIVIQELIGELIVSGFCGIITFFLCEFLEVPQLMTAVFCSVAGKMGNQSLDFFGLLFMKFFEKQLDVKLNHNEESQNDENDIDEENK